MLNSVFLYHATKAGLDLAIVNTEKLERYAAIPEEERRLAEALIDLELGDKAAGEAAVAAFTAHFRERSGQKATPAPRAAPRCRSTSAWRATSSRARKDGLIADLERTLGEARYGAARRSSTAR